MFAMFLIGMTFIAIGIFVSSLTENQLSAAIGSKAAVITVDDEGFASALQERYTDRKE